MISLNETFSADVSLHLHVGGQRFELGQLGPDFAILRGSQLISHLITPQSIETDSVELETIIDGESDRWPIRITSPITANSRRFTFEGIG